VVWLYALILLSLLAYQVNITSSTLLTEIHAVVLCWVR